MTITTWGCQSLEISQPADDIHVFSRNFVVGKGHIAKTTDHFSPRITVRYLERLADRYLKEAKAKERCGSQHYSRMQSLVTELKAKLEGLSPPELQR